MHDASLTHSLAGATIVSIAYGLDVLPSNDPYIAAAEAGLTTLAKACAPGAFLVDAFPVLKHVPDWFPGKYSYSEKLYSHLILSLGAGFKRKAKEWKQYADAMREMPFQAAKRNLVILQICVYKVQSNLKIQANGINKPSFVTYSLERLDESQCDIEDQERLIQSTAATMFTGK